MSYRHMLFVAIVALGTVAPAGESFAKEGLLARLNKSLVPSVPGLPTASPLGLLAPRLSNAVSICQFGGLGTQAGRLSLVGVISPRISPVVAILKTPPATPQARRMYVLTVVSPRAASLVGIVRGIRSKAAGIR